MKRGAKQPLPNCGLKWGCKMLSPIVNPAFERDIKRYTKKHFDMRRIYAAVEMLVNEIPLSIANIRWAVIGRDTGKST